MKLKWYFKKVWIKKQDYRHNESGLYDDILSILITFAPKSAKIIPKNGEGARPANSTTFIPLSAILIYRKPLS